VIDPRRGGRRGVPRGALDGLLGFVVGRLGVPVRGVWQLETRGRRSGRPRRVPVIPLGRGPVRHLVAPRGQTAWARNLRADGRGSLRRGPRRWPFRATEVHGEERVRVLEDYIRANRRLTGRFFEVGDPVRTEDVARIAQRHPVFRLEADRAHR
jgi:deazaflavin-dependent oxidoreductase (nitroreductase family)